MSFNPECQLVYRNSEITSPSRELGVNCSRASSLQGIIIYKAHATVSKLYVFKTLELSSSQRCSYCSNRVGVRWLSVIPVLSRPREVRNWNISPIRYSETRWSIDITCRLVLCSVHSIQGKLRGPPLAAGAGGFCIEGCRVYISFVQYCA